MESNSKRILAGALALLAGACATPPWVERPDDVASVAARVETQAVDSRGDAADDPAIWPHPEDPVLSLVIGTQKQKALHVYDLQGALLQAIPSGLPNNVDLRTGVATPDGPVDLVAASNRRFNGVDLYRVDRGSRRLVDVTDERFDTGLAQIYGLCMGQRRDTGETYVYANSKDGVIVQYLVRMHAADRAGLEEVRRLRVPSQPEGCVVDDLEGRLFLGEEAAGVWRFGAWPDDPTDGLLVARVGEHGLVADVEGLAIARTPGSGFLVASSQGNHTFAVYDRLPPHGYRGSFEIGNGEWTDGVSETDGIAIHSEPLGAFDGGLLVVQDGRNTRPRANQNFKYVDWSAVVEGLGLE